MDGTSGGDGSQGDPWDLQTALDHPAAVLAGDTIAVRGGTYTGAFTSSLAGSLGSPITVRAYPGERVTLDAHDASCLTTALIINGNDAWYWGLEVCNSLAANLGYDTADVGINIFGTRIKIINCIVHDHQMEGIGTWRAGPLTEIYGCLCYYCGCPAWSAYGIYAQNEGANGQKVLKHNLLLNNSHYGLHMYGSDQGWTQNFLVDANIIANNGSVGGAGWDALVIATDSAGSQACSNITLTNNVTWAGQNSNSQIFLANNWEDLGGVFLMHDFTIEDNYFMGGAPTVYIKGINTNLSYQRNTSWTIGAPLWAWLPADISSWTMDYNTYRRGIEYEAFSDGAHSWSGNTLAEWQAHTANYGKTLDAHSTFSAGTSPHKPTANHIVVHPNEYEEGRANIAVFNWEGLSTVDVDLSGVLAIGQGYEVRNAQNYYGAVVASGTYAGGSITLPCTGLSMATPAATAAPAYTGPEWNCFIVVPTT